MVHIYIVSIDRTIFFPLSSNCIWEYLESVYIPLFYDRLKMIFPIDPLMNYCLKHIASLALVDNLLMKALQNFFLLFYLEQKYYQQFVILKLLGERKSKQNRYNSNQ